MTTERNEYFMKRAIHLATEGMNKGAGGPFGAVIVKDDMIIAEGYNQVLSSNDPTAHAEIIAIREASRTLNSFQLSDCIIYTSCEPCPMCLGAIYWARFKKAFYACNRADAAAIEFDDHFIYEELKKKPENRKIDFTELLRDTSLSLFKEWGKKTDRKRY